MESFRWKRSHVPKVSSSAKVTTIIDRSSGDKILIPADTAHRELQQIPIQQKLPKQSSGSSSYQTRIITEEDLLSLEAGHSSSGGCLMKTLLGDGRSKETESKRQSLSVIARLMGLDMPPPQHNAGKQLKGLCEDYHENSSRLRKNSKLHASQSHRKSSKEQQPFKDVYEVGKGLKTETGSCTPRGLLNRKRCDDEIAYVKQKLPDVKRFTVSEQIQDSREFHDAYEALDSNRDILNRLLDEPDSLFAKHLHDLQVVRQSHCRHIRGVKSANALRHNIHAIGRHSSSESSRKIDISFSTKHDNGLYTESYNRHASDSCKSSHFLVDGRADVNVVPKKIVVLKPNFAKVQDFSKSASSPSLSCDLLSECEAQEYINPHHTEGFSDRKRLSHDSDSSSHRSRESKELAKEITQKMKCKLGKDSFNAHLSAYKGYSADVSSGDMSGNESSDVSEMTTLTLRTPLHASRHNRSSTSRHTDSHVNREAKKRLSERWKLANRSQAAVAHDKGSTLGEMLAIPVIDIRQRALDTPSNQDRSFGRYDQNELIPGWTGPLGISSKDGWKDGYVETLSRSKCLPTSSGSVGSPRSGTQREALGIDRCLIPKEDRACRRNRARKRVFHRKEESFIGSKGPSNMRSQALDRMDNDVLEIQFSQSEDCVLAVKGLSERKAVTCEDPIDTIDTGSTVDKLVDVEHPHAPDALNYLSDQNLTPDITSNVLVEDKSVDSNSHESSSQELARNCPSEVSAHFQCPLTQPDSPASGKESDQPSPVSVLEAPLVEDFSSGSECFERVSAELHGLRMQLKLLKQESDSYNEGLLHILSDEDDGEGSTSFFCEKDLSPDEDCWDANYLVDVLTDAGFYNSDPGMSMENWHSPECPVASCVFYNLEKQYADFAVCQTSDRKLLFDRINSAIIELSQQIRDPCPWVGRLKNDADHQWPKDELKAWVADLLVSQEEKAAGCETDEHLMNEMKWMELREHIDGIGCGIEKLLIDELVAEIAKS